MAIIFIFFITNKGYAQTIRQHADTVQTGGGRSIRTNIITDSSITKDTSLVIKDTLKKDSLAVGDTSHRHKVEDSLGIKISKDALPSKVTAEAEDSAILDMQYNVFNLYGRAKVSYEDLTLSAGKVSYQQTNNIITASPMSDVKDTGADVPTFTQGKEKFTYDSLQYNFKSKRAIVRNVHSQYGEGFVYSEQVKRNPDQSIFGLHSIYTTCALDTPHYGIVAKRFKIIPGKLIISGPANIVIEGVPTPLYLPFALFPISQKQKSGFILPTYTVEQARGLGLLNGGYYFYLNDHVDLLTQTNLYTKGSYALSGVSDYSDKYHYQGAVSLSYAYNKTGEDFEPGATTQKDFIFNWRHQSDPKSIPGQSFNASVLLGTSSYYANNSYDPNQILQNQYQSNISYSKTWQGTPFGLTISGLHSQNTQTKEIDVTLPDINFHITQLNPFQNKNAIGTHWWDKITLSYTLDALNKATFYDSTFNLSNISLSTFQTGIHHSIPISASYTILRYINMSFSVNYDEYWITDKLYQTYNDAEAKLDSTDKHGFFTSRDFSAGLSFSTRIYGLKRFKTGKLAGIRHVLTPSVGLTYHPDFGASPFNYYYRTRIDSVNYSYLSPYARSIVGLPPIGKAGAINFGINNNLQIKVRSTKDTVTGFKNVTLIDAFGINASYNAAADSFKWSDISMNFRTNVLDKINISSTANFDPYAEDYNTGRRLPQTMEDLGYGLARFTNATVSLGTNFHSKPIDASKTNPTNSEEYGRVMRNAGYNDYVDFNIPWSFNLSYSASANNQYNGISRRDTLILSQNVVFQGELKITERWKVSVNSGYDFTYKQLTLTSIDVYRDLHCWAMHLQAIPFGPRKSYSFTLNVKASVLQDLKLMRRRDFRDTPY